MNKDFMISIVIPVYNTPIFLLKKCFESITIQSYHNFEMIVVDSSDIDDICSFINDYSLVEKRMKIIKSKKGVSVQRNIGIDNSTGLYIAFIDSDDHISPNYLKDLMNSIIDKKADIAYPQLIKESYKDEEIIGTYKLVTQPPAGNVNDNNFFVNTEYNRLVNPVKLYSRKLISSERFREDLSYGEDMLFNYELSKKTFSIVFCPEAQYIFTAIHNINSASKRSPKSGFTIIKEMYRLYKNKKNNNLDNLHGILYQYNYVFSIFFYYFLRTNNFVYILKLLRYRFFYFLHNKSKHNFCYCLFPLLYKLIKKITRKD